MSKVDEVKEMVRQVVEHFGRVDALVNCTGQGYDAPVEKIDIATLRYIYDLYVVGPLVAMQEVIPLMRRHGGGSIVNVSSGLALALLPNMSPYSSTERAYSAISLAAREELKKDRIVVSVVYPYVTETDFEKNTIKHSVPEVEGKLPYPSDTAEFAARKVLEALQGGEAEVFAHDWMKRIGRGDPSG
jgi:short-subunit dehydrogenase